MPELPSPIWLQEAHQFNERDEPENVLCLVYCETAEIAKYHIQHYQQNHRIRLAFSLNILPFDKYLQHHADDELKERLFAQARQLSDQHRIILFYPHRFTLPRASEDCLSKQTFRIPSWSEQKALSPFARFEVPEVIRSHLWRNEPDDKCYAIIHAATVWIFPDFFQREAFRSACLFQGEKAEANAKIAPYLVELPVGHNILPHLFCRNGENYAEGINYGERNIGIFFRSSAEFDELLHHFRKFLILPTYDKHQYYFRFYDPIVLENYLDRLQTYPTKLAAFFNGSMLEKVFCIKNGDELVEYVPRMDFSTIPQAKKQFDRFEIDEITEERNGRLCREMTEALSAQYPEFIDRYGRENVEKTVAHAFRLAKAANMSETMSILLFAFYNLLYGDSVNYLDPEGELNAILNSDLPELEKRIYIEKRITLLARRHVISSPLTGEPHV